MQDSTLQYLWLKAVSGNGHLTRCDCSDSARRHRLLCYLRIDMSQAGTGIGLILILPAHSAFLLKVVSGDVDGSD